MLQIPDRNLTHKILLPEIFGKSKIKYFKDQIGSSEPNLLNFLPCPIFVDISVNENIFIRCWEISYNRLS